MSVRVGFREIQLILTRRLGDINVAAGRTIDLVEADRAVVTLSAGGAAADDPLVAAAL